MGDARLKDIFRDKVRGPKLGLNARDGMEYLFVGYKYEEGLRIGNAEFQPSVFQSIQHQEGAIVIFTISNSLHSIMDDDNLIDTTFPPPSSRSGSRTPRKTKNKPPQDILTQFWDQFNTKCPGKVYTVLPDNPYARSKAARTPKGTIQGQNAAKSYDQAKRECIRSVNRIVQECERVNQKYTDPHFDIEVDLKSRRRDYLDGLEEINLEMRPKGVKRVTVRNIPFLSLMSRISVMSGTDEYSRM